VLIGKYLINMKEQILNSLHIIGGIAVMYYLGHLMHFETYTTEAKYVGVPLVSIFLGYFTGRSWEELWKYFKGSPINVNDIIRTATGFLIGGLLATI